MSLKTITPLLAGLLCLHLILVASPTHAQSIEDLKKGVVKITAKANGHTRIGTGFVVRIEKEAAYIVTAAHVIEGASTVAVEFYTERNRQYAPRIIGQENGEAQGLTVKFGVHLHDRPVILKQEELTRLVGDARTFQHDYEARTMNGERVVLDRSAGLMWQQEGIFCPNLPAS